MERKERGLHYLKIESKIPDTGVKKFCKVGEAPL
jgi:hypothetical protein